MFEHQVTCIDKPNYQSQHEHITHIGNVTESWRMTREEAIRRIDSQKNRFYTVDSSTGMRAYIEVIRGDGDKLPYLRTRADKKLTDNLLNLSQCSIAFRLVDATYP